MHRIKIFFCFFILLLVSSISCTLFKHKKSIAVLPGTWQITPIVIDGDCKDWPSPYPNYDSKSMVAYATSNDNNYLYVTMQTGDELTQMKILKMGMTVSIDTNGKKSPQFNINYPLQNDNTMLIDMPASNEKQKNDLHPSISTKQRIQKINAMAKEANQFALDGFTNCNGVYMLSQTTACGIKVKLSIDEYKELVWEAAIPFKVIYNKDTLSMADAGKPISVCFAVKGVAKPSSKSNETAQTTPMASNAAGGRSNSMKGGGGGFNNSSSDPNFHLYESTKTWKQFGLTKGNVSK